MFRGQGPTRLPATVVFLVAVVFAWPARAETDGQGPALGWSVGTGCVLMLGAMAAGGGFAASSTNDRQRKTGFEIMAGGLVLAPVASHAIAREWKRAAVFGAVTVSMAVTATLLLEDSRAILDFGRPIDRVPFGAAMAVELMAAGVGLSDSLMAGERARARNRIAVLPLVAGRAPGLTVGGLL